MPIEWILYSNRLQNSSAPVVVRYRRAPHIAPSTAWEVAPFVWTDYWRVKLPPALKPGAFLTESLTFPSRRRISIRRAGAQVRSRRLRGRRRCSLPHRLGPWESARAVLISSSAMQPCRTHSMQARRTERGADDKPPAIPANSSCRRHSVVPPPSTPRPTTSPNARRRADARPCGTGAPQGHLQIPISSC